MKSGGCEGEHCVGEALYKNDVNGTGWAYLELETRDTASDVVQAYGGGFLEGWVTRDLLYLQYQNTIVGRCDGKQELCRKINKWVKENTNWVRKQLAVLR